MARHVVVFLIYVTITVALTWPLALDLGGFVPHDLGDPLLSMAILWWNADVVPFTARWWDGFFFFPGQFALTMSDHRVGVSLITSPLIWSGVSLVAAHNVAYLATFFLTAMAAYALGFTLTGSTLAAFVGGLIFGFNPFRAGHLPHLELLASYWLPIVLVALHRWADTRRPLWLVLLAASLTLQALTSGYYFFFLGVLIGLWLLWFLPRRASLREYASLGVALATPLILIAPILLVYREAHTLMALSRSIRDIEFLSADIRGLITPPHLLWLWDTPESWLRVEGDVLIGVTGLLLIVIAAIARPTSIEAVAAPRWLVLARRGFLAAVIVALLVAVFSVTYGPMGFEVAGLRISSSSAYKPISVATVFLILWVMTAPRMRDALHRQSPFAFYVLATIAMWLFALGPTARLLGERVLYKAPYSWLMLMPGFRDEFRAPARFAMLAALTMSAAAAIAFYKLFLAQPRGRQLAAFAVVSTAILLESWVAPFPLERPPAPLEIPAAVPADAAVLEVPVGVYEDATAMYHATIHHRRILNGLSGYDPPHYSVVRVAFEDKAPNAVVPLAAYADIAIFVARASAAEWVPLIESQTGAVRIATTSTHEVLLLRRSSGDQPPQALASTSLPIRGLASNLYPENLGRMLDGDRFSAWSSENPQVGGEEFTVDLGEMAELDGVRLVLGAHLTGFPRLLVIETSSDGSEWTEAWRGSAASAAVIGAMQDLRQAPMWFPLADRRARFIRFKQLAQSESGWVVAELRVFGRR